MGARLFSPPLVLAASPFDLDDNATYRRWRDWKLAHQPTSAGALSVEVGDPRALNPSERAALLVRIAQTNMALYRSPMTGEDKDIPRLLGAQLGLHQLDGNWLADEDGISQITVSEAHDGRGGFIPYTDRPIRWHTDGYYHPAERRIRGMLLHCVRPARSGGENALLDHEMAYIALRDASPDHVRALMQPDAMTIPARTAPKLTAFAAPRGDAQPPWDGPAATERTDDDGVARAAQTGPVFSIDAADGSLHMRYTARTRSIEWKNDAATRAAVACLERLLAGAAPWILRTRLEPGMGLVSHNVLHDRSGFDDDPLLPRLLYRARFLDRVDVPAGAPWRNG